MCFCLPLVSSASSSETPTANIKPTPVVATPSKPAPSQGNKPTPRASIRPMVTPAPVPTPTPTATVMPTTQETQEENQVDRDREREANTQMEWGRAEEERQNFINSQVIVVNIIASSPCLSDGSRPANQLALIDFPLPCSGHLGKTTVMLFLSLPDSSWGILKFKTRHHVTLLDRLII